MKEKILKLRSEGKSYKEIKKILGCSSGTISFHCGVGQKEKSKKRCQKYREKVVITSKVNNFKNPDRRLKDKTEDFQRVRLTKNGNTKLGKRELTFRWQDIIEKFGWETICYLTGKKINLREPKTYHFDHKIPYSKGGDCSIENLGIVTKQANCAKSNMSIDEFILLCKEILEFQGYIVKKSAIE